MTAVEMYLQDYSYATIRACFRKSTDLQDAWRGWEFNRSVEKAQEQLERDVRLAKRELKRSRTI